MIRFALAAMVTVGVLAATVACSSTAGPGSTHPTGEAPRASPYPIATSSIEVAERVGGCLNELGWEVEVSGNGYTYEIPPEQTDAFRRDSDQCQIDTNSVIPEFESTPELAAVEYEAMEHFHDCLAEQGVDVPPLPSYTVFEDRLLVEEAIYDLAGLIGLPHDDPLRTRCNDPIPTFGTKG